VFLQNYPDRRIFRINFLLKKRWNRSTVASPPVHGNFIKPGPSIRQSAAWIKWAEGVFHVLISSVGWHVDGGKLFFSLSSLTRDKASETPWPAAWASSSSSYGAWNDARFLRTRSRLWEELILRTYHGENGPQEASDREVSQAVLTAVGMSSDGASAPRTPLAVTV
jgi:hypothetical protein